MTPSLSALLASLPILYLDPYMSSHSSPPDPPAPSALFSSLRHAAVHQDDLQGWSTGSKLWI
eukprot:768705-Hanusia_phi.AAC.7